MSGSNNALLDSLAHPAQVNLLADYGGAANTANAIWANRQWQARQAAGQNFLNSINPDGTPNQNALLQGARNTPGMALVAQPSAQAGQTLSADTQTQDLQLRATVNQMLPSLLKAPDDQLHGGVVQGFLQLEKMGLLTHERSLQIQGGLSNDPAQLRTQLTQIQTSNQGPEQQQQTVYGRPVTADNGQQVVGGTQSVQTGGLNVPPGQGVQKQTGPETNAAQSETYIENPKVPGTYLKVLTPRSAMPGASGVAPGTSPLGTGRPAAGSPLLNPNATPAPDAAPATAPLAAPPPGANETVAADVGKFKQDQFAIPQGQQAVQSLQKAQLALEASSTGRNSEGVHNMWATLQTLGVPIPNGQATDVSSYDVAHKYLMDYARKSGAAAHSDLQLQTSEGANASTGISNQAALDVVHTNIGRERQAIAQNLEAQQTGVGYGGHAAKFASSTDPRGFAIDAYKPADLNPNDPKSMVGKMTDSERARFYKSVGIAQRLKLINPAGS